MDARLRGSDGTKLNSMQQSFWDFFNLFTCDRPQSSQNRGRSAHICQKLVEVLVTQSVPLLHDHQQKGRVCIGIIKNLSEDSIFPSVFYPELKCDLRLQRWTSGSL